MKHARPAFAVVSILALGAPMSAIAQDEQPETNETMSEAAMEHHDDQPGDTSTIVGSIMQPPTAGPRVTLRGSYRLQFESDFDNAPGDFSVNRAFVGLNIADSLNEDIFYSLDFLVEHSSYDFNAASSLVPGSNDPLDDALSLTFTPSFRFALSDEWAVHTGGALFVNGETDADFTQSVRASVFGGVERKFSDRLTLSLLIVAWSRLEDSAQVFPLLTVSWQINELMRLQTRGLGAEFISDLGNGWSLGARAAWEYREYRLSDSSGAPLPEGVLRDTGIVASLELAWKPSHDVVLAIEGGGVLAQELEFLDRGGALISQTDADPALFVGIRASFAF